jgi:hypothetical protein
MRSVMITALTLALSAGAAFAQAVVPPALVTPVPGGADPSAKTGERASKKGAHDNAIASCERLWDAGTHMTKTEWSRTCRRVQDRIRQYEQD